MIASKQDELTSSDIDASASMDRQILKSAVDSWFPSIYDCLRDIAHRRMQNESPGHTLQPTALVHDAYIRLTQYQPDQWNDRVHFLAVAARVLRELLVDHGRRKASIKRGGGWCRITLDEMYDVDEEYSVDILSLDDAMHRLSTHSPRASSVVELRFFGGLTIEETAQAMDVSVGTVKQDWRFARAWLLQKLEEQA